MRNTNQLTFEHESFLFARAADSVSTPLTGSEAKPPRMPANWLLVGTRAITFAVRGDSVLGPDFTLLEHLSEPPKIIGADAEAGYGSLAQLYGIDPVEFLKDATIKEASPEQSRYFDTYQSDTVIQMGFHKE